MRKLTVRTAIILAAVCGMSAAVAPAHADAGIPAANSGVTFYSGSFTSPLLTIPDPSGTCDALPAAADSLIGWTGVENVVVYRAADCTGTAVSLGTLRTFPAGVYSAFRAY